MFSRESRWWTRKRNDGIAREIARLRLVGGDPTDAVAEAIAKLDEAHYVAITTGAYDVFIWAGLESAESLGTFLRTKIGVIEGVQRTETFVNLAIKKRTYGLVL